MNKRKARIKLSNTLFKDSLGMPIDTEICDVRIDRFNDTMELLVSSPDFPEVEDGTEYPLLTPTPTRVEWNWNLPEKSKWKICPKCEAECGQRLMRCGACGYVLDPGVTCHPDSAIGS